MPRKLKTVVQKIYGIMKIHYFRISQNKKTKDNSLNMISNNENTSWEIIINFYQCQID